MSSFLTKIKISGRLFFTSGFFTLDLESKIFVPQSKSKLKSLTGLNKMIIKITFHDVHVRRSYFNRQNSQLFNLGIPMVSGKYNIIGCFFLFHLKVGVEESIVNALYGSAV
jgi:hypothetical protein